MGKPITNKNKTYKPYSCPFCHNRIYRYNRSGIEVNFCSTCGEHLHWHKKIFKDDSYYYVALTHIADTEDELKSDLLNKTDHPVDLSVIETYEVKGSDLNKIPKNVYKFEYWKDLLDRYQHVPDVDNNIKRIRKEETNE